jgi:phage baseplate assembly protein W
VSTARYRAWRFVFPELQQEEQISGLGLTARGGAAMVDEADSVRQAILLLLATRPGERVMRPDYGCDLFKLVFAPGDNTTPGLAMHYVREALARWEPRIDIAELDASVDPERPGRLDIVLQYRLRMTRQWDQAALALNLHTGGLS